MGKYDLVLATAALIVVLLSILLKRRQPKPARKFPNQVEPSEPWPRK